MKKIIVLFALAWLTANVYAQDKPQVKVYCDKKLSTITYAMHHPMHSWTAVSKDVTAVIVTDENKNLISQVAVSVKISSFDSQNANRDSHTMEATEAIKYPNITFNSTSVKQDGNKFTVAGNIVFHGVTQPVTFDAERKISGGKTEIVGGFNVTITQFKIDPPSLMGIATDDEIKLAFDVIF